MLFNLLSLTMGLFFGSAQPANYYPNYTSAKMAAKETQKEMLVFFSGKSCSNCESAWSAFTKDFKSTQSYVSTRMDIEDFDGGVCFDLYELKQVPAWVILSSNAEIKEKWNGGWKDASGNPTGYDIILSQPINKEEKKEYTPPPTPSKQKSISGSLPTNDPEMNSKKVVSTSKSTTVSPTSTTSSEYFLQAGYFSSDANAQKLVADLKSKGFSNFNIDTVQKDGKNYYRVISKSFNTESDVNVEQRRMSTSGIKTSVIKPNG